MRYVFHPEALNEYTEAVQYYIDAIVEWIEVFYNRQRIHSTLDNLSPVRFEQQYWLSLQQPRAA